MKQAKYHMVFRSYLVFLAFLIGMIGAGSYLILSMVTVKTLDGVRVRSNWQKVLTQDFKKQIIFEDEKPYVKQEGIDLLEEKGITLQVIDDLGNEVIAYPHKDEIAYHYSNAELLKMAKEDHIYMESIKEQGREWLYMLTFPKSVVKVTMYLNAKQFTSGRSLSFLLIAIILGAMMIIATGYSYFWMKNMRDVTLAIEDIGRKSYLPIEKKNAFREIYKQLNHLDDTLRAAESSASKTEALRREWISNITHDLKTPLAPIRGYAEIIEQTGNTLTNEEIKQYAQIMLKNISYSEALIGDLKLTYQLESGVFPLNKKRGNIVRFLKELVIDLLNQPDYMDRQIAFESQEEEIIMAFDEKLLRRAFNNLIINSLVHNQIETEIKISLQVIENQVQISLLDNGRGMSKEEVAHLFERYYRGTNTQRKPEGTGLGMAIAKQIINLHEGDIEVFSEVGNGTQFKIIFYKI